MKYTTTARLDLHLEDNPQYKEHIVQQQFREIGTKLLPALAVEDGCFIAKLTVTTGLNEDARSHNIERAVYYEQLTKDEYDFLLKALQHYRGSLDAKSFLTGGKFVL
jgi:hypothetical protein